MEMLNNFNELMDISDDTFLKYLELTRPSTVLKYNQRLDKFCSHMSEETKHSLSISSDLM